MQNEINVTQLILFCHEEMETRDYSEDYKCRVSKAWDALVEWAFFVFINRGRMIWPLRPKWIGDYIIRVVSRQTVLASQSLNDLMNQSPGDPLIFGAPEFTLVFKDYNGDGMIDFNLGQYFSTNGNIYMLFTVDAEGNITKLPIENRDALFISGTGHVNSTDAIISEGQSIKVYFYDNIQGEYFEASYEWNNEKKMFVFAFKARSY